MKAVLLVMACLAWLSVTVRKDLSIKIEDRKV